MGRGQGSGSWRHALVVLVDDLYAGDGGVTPGLLGSVARGLDDLRNDRDSSAEVAQVETMTVKLHEFRDLLRTKDRSSARAADLRRDLHRLATDWMRDARVTSFA